MSWHTKLAVAVVALLLPLPALAGQVEVISGDGYRGQNVVVVRPAPVVVRDVRVGRVYAPVFYPAPALTFVAPAYCAPPPMVYYHDSYCGPTVRAGFFLPRVSVDFFGRIGHGLRVGLRF